MSKYLIGYFSRRGVFHVVAYRDTQAEVDAFMENRKPELLVYTIQPKRAKVAAGKDFTYMLSQQIEK